MSQQGPRWACFSWLLLDNEDGSRYMDRFRSIQTPWFGLYVHWLYSGDSGHDLHDHPWWFFSFLLKGRYEEECGEVMVEDGEFLGLKRWINKVNWFNYKRPTDLHRVTKVTNGPVITLVLAGPRSRQWGFVDPFGKWILAENHDQKRVRKAG